MQFKSLIQCCLVMLYTMSHKVLTKRWIMSLSSAALSSSSQLPQSLLNYNFVNVSMFSSVSYSKMIHIVCPETNYASKVLGLDISEAIFLIQIGAVYHIPCPKNTQEYELKKYYKASNIKARRLLQDIIIQKNDYIRYHRNPRRYPTDIVNWTRRIKHQHHDFIIVDKPAGIPCNPSVDNLHENVLESLKSYFNFDELYLPHRLDTDTSGLLLLGKNKENIGKLGNLFRNRYISKVYKTLVISSSTSKNNYENYTHSAENVLKSLSPLQILTHFTKPSLTSPKVFSSHEFEGSITCYSRILNVSPVVTHTCDEWFNWINNLQSSSVTFSLPSHKDTTTIIPSVKSELKSRLSDLVDSSSVTNVDAEPIKQSTYSFTDDTDYNQESENEKDIYGFQSPHTRFQYAFKSWLDTCATENNHTNRISFCEIELELLSGKTHQIRGHMHCLGEGIHIAGDLMYTGIVGNSSNCVVAEATNVSQTSSDTAVDINNNKSDIKNTEVDRSNPSSKLLETFSHYRPSPFLALQASQLAFNYSSIKLASESESESIEAKKVSKGKLDNVNGGHSMKAVRKAMRKQYLKSVVAGNSNNYTYSILQKDNINIQENRSPFIIDDFEINMLDSNIKKQNKTLQYDAVSVNLSQSWWQPLSEYLLMHKPQDIL